LETGMSTGSPVFYCSNLNVKSDGMKLFVTTQKKGGTGESTTLCMKSYSGNRN